MDGAVRGLHRESTLYNHLTLTAPEAVNPPVSKGAHMDPRLEHLAAERASLAAESERLAVILAAERSGRALRAIALAYGTGCRDDFDRERQCREDEEQMKLVRSRARALDRQYHQLTASTHSVRESG